MFQDFLHQDTFKNMSVITQGDLQKPLERGTIHIDQTEQKKVCITGKTSGLATVFHTPTINRSEGGIRMYRINEYGVRRLMTGFDSK